MTLYSPFFLFAFLPFSAAVYNALPTALRKTAMCIINLAFYAFAAGRFFYVLPCLTLVSYVLSFLGKKAFFIILALLPVMRMCGICTVGVSFFILRAAAYFYDDYHEKNLLSFFAFLMFFPLVHAGPLASYDTFRGGFERGTDYRRISRGICLTLSGAAKKLFFADSLYQSFDLFFGGTTSLSALFALFSYALYIYFDFSGCSDMARGIAAMFGFDIPLNFDFPYMSKSVSEFFRRWHMTLGRWLFKYVYLPLGGSKNGKGRMVLSLLATWLVSALWHGSTFSYLLWGVYFFLICTAEKLIFDGKKGFGRATTIMLVLFGWVLFFSKTPADAYSFFYRLFSLGNTLLYCRGDIYNCLRQMPFLLVSLVCATPLLHRAACMLYQRMRPVAYIAALPVLALVLSCLAAGGHMPFLYATF